MMEPLRLPATLESLKSIREYVGLVASAADLSQAQSYGLALAVDEIATNIITHGYMESGRTGDILIHADITDGGVELTLEDTGIPFNPLLREKPDDLDAPLADRDIGGLGLFLAQKNVDEFRYNYLNGRNHNIFVIHAKNFDNLAAIQRD
jgi:serine/threonine-protein kinase RsbW